MSAFPLPRRILVMGSSSGNGKTTVGRELAQILGVRFVELDSMVHGPNWVETPDKVLRRQLEPIVASDGWVFDGDYERKVGDLVRNAADLIVWLDLPMRVWLPRLARRTFRRMRGSEVLWNENRESLRNAFWGWDSLFIYALRAHFRHRRQWPQHLARYRVIRLRSTEEVERFMAQARSALGRPAGEAG